jgi:hypothetical protein
LSIFTFNTYALDGLGLVKIESSTAGAIQIGPRSPGHRLQGAGGAAVDRNLVGRLTNSPWTNNIGVSNSLEAPLASQAMA